MVSDTVISQETFFIRLLFQVLNYDYNFFISSWYKALHPLSHWRKYFWWLYLDLVFLIFHTFFYNNSKNWLSIIFGKQILEELWQITTNGAKTWLENINQVTTILCVNTLHEEWKGLTYCSNTCCGNAIKNIFKWLFRRIYQCVI